MIVIILSNAVLQLLLIINNHWVVAWLLVPRLSHRFSFTPSHTYCKFTSLQRYSVSSHFVHGNLDDENENDNNVYSTLTLDRYRCAGIDSFDADTRQALRKCKSHLDIQHILCKVFIIETSHDVMRNNGAATINSPSKSRSFLLEGKNLSREHCDVPWIDLVDSCLYYAEVVPHPYAEPMMKGRLYSSEVQHMDENQLQHSIEMNQRNQSMAHQTFSSKDSFLWFQSNPANNFLSFILRGLRPRVAVTALRSWMDQQRMTISFLTESRGIMDNYSFAWNMDDTCLRKHRIPDNYTSNYFATDILPLLLKNIQEAIHVTAGNIHQRIHPNYNSTSLHSNVALSSLLLLDMYSLADMIHILAELHIYKNIHFSPLLSCTHSLNNIDNMIDQICTIISYSSLLQHASISERNEIFQQSPLPFISSIRIHRLVSTFCSLTICSQVSSSASQLLKHIGDRLEKSDALGQLTPLETTQIIGAMVYYSSHKQKVENPYLFKAVLRLLRKQHIRNKISTMQLFHVLNSTRGIVQTWDESSSMYMEAETFSYTILKEISSRLNNTKVLRNNSMIISDKRIGTASNTRANISIKHFADVLSTCAYFNMSLSNVIIHPIMRHFTRYHYSSTYPSSMEDVAYILEKIRYLNPCLRSYALEDGHTNTLLEVVNILGKTFLHTTSRLDYSRRFIDVDSFSSVMRSVSEILLRKYKLVNSYAKAAMTILSRFTHYICDCNDIQLGHIAVVLSHSHSSISHDFIQHDIFQKLVRCILDSNRCKQVSPESASSIVWSMANIVEDPHYQQLLGSKEYGTIRRLLFELFYSLSPSLLAQTVGPMHSSRAMWAMAKASYTADAGIFDHLAERMSHHIRLGSVEVIDVAQSLWACAKMSSWEDPLRDQSASGISNSLPYLYSASEMAYYLSMNTNPMSSKDIAQAIWSCGRLKIMNSLILRPLCCAAINVGNINSHEMANILWGLAKVDFHKDPNSRELIIVLSKRIRERRIISHCSPQEASNILYALAKMNTADEETFSAMTGVILSQLTNATAQTIANTLWAHECVRIKPPRAMLDLWVKEKLDINGVYIGD